MTEFALRRVFLLTVLVGVIVGGSFASVTPALASPPVIATDGAHATSESSAIISGNGDPGGLSTSIHADYALASEVWCTSQGAEGTPRETGHHELGSGNIEISEILVELTGLSPSGEYCAELVAENGEGTDNGRQVTFTTPTPPSIHSESASHITSSDATLEAEINPEWQETIYEIYLEKTPVVLSGFSSAADPCFSCAGDAGGMFFAAMAQA